MLNAAKMKHPSDLRIRFFGSMDPIPFQFRAKNPAYSYLGANPFEAYFPLKIGFCCVCVLSECSKSEMSCVKNIAKRFSAPQLSFLAVGSGKRVCCS